MTLQFGWSTTITRRDEDRVGEGGVCVCVWHRCYIPLSLPSSSRPWAFPPSGVPPSPLSWPESVMNALLPLPLSLNRRGREGGREGRKTMEISEGRGRGCGADPSNQEKGDQKRETKKRYKRGQTRERERRREGNTDKERRERRGTLLRGICIFWRGGLDVPTSGFRFGHV